jgi:hypothetical protein
LLYQVLSNKDWSTKIPKEDNVTITIFEAMCGFGRVSNQVIKWLTGRKVKNQKYIVHLNDQSKKMIDEVTNLI